MSVLIFSTKQLPQLTFCEVFRHLIQL